VLAVPPGRSAALLAAHQLIQLTAGVADRPGAPCPPRELTRLVHSGESVFLAAYGVATEN
jgi:hypothetical protein